MNNAMLGMDRDYILSRALPVTPRSGIYFLIQDGEIVYVGKSIHIPLRLRDHKRNGKIYSHVFFVECQKEDLDELERHYIQTFLPRLNIALKRQAEIKKQAAVKRQRKETVRVRQKVTRVKVQSAPKIDRKTKAGLEKKALREITIAHQKLYWTWRYPAEVARIRIKRKEQGMDEDELPQDDWIKSAPDYVQAGILKAYTEDPEKLLLEECNWNGDAIYGKEG
jgi:hypothetical protein